MVRNQSVAIAPRPCACAVISDTQEVKILRGGNAENEWNEGIREQCHVGNWPSRRVLFGKKAPSP